MNILKTLSFIIAAICIVSCNSIITKPQIATSSVVFQEDSLRFSDPQKDFIRSLISKSELEIRDLLPNLPDSIKVIVEAVDWELDAVNGVTGRAESNNPPLIFIQISHDYKNGVIDSVHNGVKSTIYHEFHHLSRGWAIQDNKFSYGIPNAMVNEGLAVAFTETHTGIINEVNSYTDEADNWVKEIIALPLDVSYYEWVMGEHPDGRTYIGYRTGNYLANKALTKSGKSILELSELTPDEIIQLAGY